MPVSASAQVVISEVMYDLDGSDSGYEWVEVFNAGSSSVLLTDWRLFEADVNHKISAVQGSESLAPGAYAIIADNSGKFLQKFTYSGQLFDSAFSLSNSGETLILRNADFIDKDTVSYTGDMGAAGDGNSLQRTSSTGVSFTAGVPTLGTGSLSQDSSLDVEPSATSSTNDDTTQQSSSKTASGASVFSVEPEIYAYAGEDRKVIVGADVAFEAALFSKSGEVLTIDSVRYLWNFGDGAIATGESILHHWNHPGRYVLVLDIAQEKNAASDSVIITAEPAKIEVDMLDDGSIVLTNNAGRTLDLSGWHIAMAGGFFTLPKHSKILAGEDVAFSPDVTGLTFIQSPAELWYPNGKLAVREGSDPEPAPIVSTPAQASAPRVSSGVVGRALPIAVVSEPEEEFDAEEVAYVEDEENRQVAAAAVAQAGNGGISGWVWGLAALLIVASVAIISIRQYRRSSWEIIEE